MQNNKVYRLINKNSMNMKTTRNKNPVIKKTDTMQLVCGWEVCILVGLGFDR